MRGSASSSSRAVTPTSRRCSAFRICVVCINKMDLVGFAADVFDKIRATFRDFSGRLGFKDVKFIPISALKGRQRRASEREHAAGTPEVRCSSTSRHVPIAQPI